VTPSILKDAAARASSLRMPALVKTPGPGPVLLLAPHPDDEVLGAGGTLRKHVAAGDEVSVAFVTDGRRGGRSRRAPGDIAQVRMQEARAACARLGVHACDFLGAADGTFEPDGALAAAVRDLVARRRPRLLYVPGFEERHRDHLLTSALAAQAWLDTGGDWTVCAYEVWTPLRPNCVVDVTAHMDDKRAAMLCHASQLERLDYTGAMEGLARYRAALAPLPHVRFAEAFWRCTPEEHAGALIEFLRDGSEMRDGSERRGR
jgi:LmbE family N-acetylglucosaminyl deacetylase